jgi:hypothetical protein
MATITSANAVYQLSIPAVFPGGPQTLQGFAADEIYGTDPIDAGETLMGVDGILSAGFVYDIVRQTIVLQADSPSAFIFDTWWTSERAIPEKLPASGTIALPTLGIKYTMPFGFLKSYMSIPDGRRILQPRRFVIHWQQVSFAPIAYA